MSVTSQIEFEEENGQVRAVDTETGESGIGKDQKDALTNLIKALETLDDIVRVTKGIEEFESTIDSFDKIREYSTIDVDQSIVLVAEDGWWIATERSSDVTSQGRTREAALENLDEALRAYDGEGHTPSDDELREIGIDPKKNVSDDSLPEVFK